MSLLRAKIEKKKDQLKVAYLHVLTAHLFARRVNEDRLANNLSLYSLIGTKITSTIKKQIIVIGMHDGFQHTFGDNTPLKFVNKTFR